MTRDELFDPRSGTSRLAAVMGGPPPEVGGLDPPDGGDDPSAWRTWVEEFPQPPPEQSGSARRARRWVPQSLRGARIDPGRRGAVVLAIVAVVAAVITAVVVWGGRPKAEPIAALPVVSATDPVAAVSTAPPSAGAAPGPLVVSVTGKVGRPGLVTVPDGARVADVLAAAGGALPGVDVTVLNLARKVADGEQVAVGVPAAPDAVPAAGGATSGTASGPAAAAGPIDLNSAGATQLDTLPGVGPVTAQRIVEWRTRNGRFARVEQLREIEGIGERRFEQLRGLVKV